MKNQSHRNHWEALFSSEKEILKWLKEVRKGGDFVVGRETTYNNGEEDLNQAKVFAIEKSDGPIALRALEYNDDKSNHNTLVTAFPVGKPLACCVPVHLKHYCLYQWHDRLEANIDCTSQEEESWHVNFFNTDYITQKHMIRLYDDAEYNLVGFALDCGFQRPDKLELKIERQNNEDYPDIYEFWSTVSNVEAFTSFGVPMYRMKVTILRYDGDVNITLYARKSFFDRMPKEGEPVKGVMWLQGEMHTDLYELLQKSDDGGEVTQMTSQFLQAVRSINHEGYDDLNLLIEPFEELNMRNGYVLDGFYADRGDESYTKLYFSAAGSEWRYLPEIEDGQFTPKFDDRMYIHNHLDESVNDMLPPLTDYIEGPFTESAIWAMYMLMTAEYYLPMTNGLGEIYRVPITRKLDFIRLNNEHLTEFSKDERVKSGVSIVNENTAVVSCAFWSQKQGICIEETIVTRKDNGYKFGTSRILPIA